MKKILFIFGTRPEAIKLAPLIKKMEKEKNDFEVEVCVTAQHRQMLDQVLNFFDIKPKYDLNLMTKNQSLSVLFAEATKGISEVLKKSDSDYVVVQGDTTTSLAGALTAFYEQKKIIYIEDGLRSGDRYSPYPEEINRTMISKLADYHFAPTKQAVKNLEKEGIQNNIWEVGNTVIDALFSGLEIIRSKNLDLNLDFSKKIILVTGHRRENFGKPLENICQALKDLAEKYPDIQIVYPVHPNPNVKDVVYKILDDIKNIYLVEPLDYPNLISLMQKSYFIITDSGGIQEEAPSLGKPILVTREVTERQEGIQAGTAKLVGTDINKIKKEVVELLENEEQYQKMSKAVNPYGDGKTSERIIDILKKN